MDDEARIRYHLHELEMARNPAAPGHVAPSFSAADRAILDVGCGIGQTFVANTFGPEVVLVGVDHDAACLRYGSSRFGRIAFVNASAEKLPFTDGSFDRVISRVSLPYTDIPRALQEIARVLRQGGEVWFTLHSFSRTFGSLGGSARRFKLKECALRLYVIANGLLFHGFGKVVPMPRRRRYESCQSESAMIRALRRAGFDGISVQKGSQFVMTASKSGSVAAPAGAGRAG